MPTFKKDTDGFMKGPSGFKMKYSPNKKTGEGFPFKAVGGIQQYDASPMSKPLVGDQDKLPKHLQEKILASPMKKYGKSAYKKDKKVPNIPVKSPDATVKMLQAKKDAGTITAAELKKLKELQRMMETGPGSYGNEQYDKE
tara:strand:+ start:2384 stop:2806 length:423 start_codon:yes stop_codon:yes gene_type:complete